MVRGRDLEPFLQSVLKLKSVRRAGWVSKVKVRSAESVADHTFSTSAVAMVLADIIGLDTARVMKMVILHDLAESIVGDHMPGDVSSKEKIRQEKKAMNVILKCLPNAVRLDYSKVWNEYLNNRTDAARFVHRVDKLEMAMQAGSYAVQGYDRKLLAPFFNSARAALGNKNDLVGQIFSRYSRHSE